MTPLGQTHRENEASTPGFRLGTSQAMQRVQKLIEWSAASAFPVLITGELGVGKDLVAREIHRRSARRPTFLWEVHAASLPSNFFDLPSSATEWSTAPGRARQLEALPGSTLFLDDIGELSSPLQDGLLHWLRRIGGSEDSLGRELDFRLIGGTHTDLTEAVEAGSFSEELYYRVNLIRIHVPPLREHPEDIPALLQHFIQVHGERERWQGELPEILLDRFRSYAWPGNVRELENALRRFFVLGDPAYVLDELEAQYERWSRRPSRLPVPTAAVPFSTTDHGLRVVRHDESVDLKELGRRASALAEREAIQQMLIRTQGNKKAAAHRLGISYKAILYKIRDFGIAGQRGALAPVADDSA